MGKLRARTEDEFQSRKKEILIACEQLCREREYDEITLTDIAQMTALSRPSMYNYYPCKEELFLDLLKTQCTAWANALQAAFQACDDLNEESFCSIFTEILCRHELTLRLMSQVLSTIEKACSIENVMSFRREMERIATILLRTTARIFPNTTALERGNLMTQIMIYIHGIYPITHIPRSLIEKWTQDGQAVGTPDMRMIAMEGIHMILRGFCCSHR